MKWFDNIINWLIVLKIIKLHEEVKDITLVIYGRKATVFSMSWISDSEEQWSAYLKYIKSKWSSTHQTEDSLPRVGSYILYMKREIEWRKYNGRDMINSPVVLVSPWYGRGHSYLNDGMPNNLYRSTVSLISLFSEVLLPFLLISLVGMLVQTWNKNQNKGKVSCCVLMSIPSGDAASNSQGESQVSAWLAPDFCLKLQKSSS